MSPDVHFVRLRDKLVAELRMSHGNNRLGLLPGGEALEVHAAVLRDKIVNVCTGIGDDGAVRKVGRMRDCRFPCLSVKVEEQQMKLLPPLERYAPSTKSSCPPAPLIGFVPADSALT